MLVALSLSPSLYGKRNLHPKLNFLMAGLGLTYRTYAYAILVDTNLNQKTG